MLAERAALKTSPKKVTNSSKKFSKYAWQFLSLPLVLFISLPLISLFTQLNPSNFWQNLQQEQVLQAMSLSLTTSITTVALTILFGTPVAYMLSRRRTQFSRFIDTLVDLPSVLPPTVAGLGLLMAFGRRGLLGDSLYSFGISIPFTQIAVIMAQTFIAAPLYIKTVTVGFANVDCDLKKAAALDGASRWETFRYVMVPMARMSMLSGSVLTWARALGEFGATIIFAGNFPGRTQTMPLAIYLGFEIEMNVALTLSVVLICFSFLTLVLVKGILHQKMEIEVEDTFD